MAAWSSSSAPGVFRPVLFQPASQGMGVRPGQGQGHRHRIFARDAFGRRAGRIPERPFLQPGDQPRQPLPGLWPPGPVPEGALGGTTQPGDGLPGKPGSPQPIPAPGAVGRLPEGDVHPAQVRAKLPKMADKVGVQDYRPLWPDDLFIGRFPDRLDVQAVIRFLARRVGHRQGEL